MNDHGPALSCAALALVMLFPMATLAGENEAAAKAKFQAAVAMFQKENYPAALKAFEDSYRLNPKGSVLYNIAMCQKALFRYVDAIATFEKYLREEAERIPKDKRGRAEAAIAEMKLLVGAVQVENAPDAADILLDGEKIGVAPFAAPVSVDPGAHTLHVMKEGFDSFETKISVESGAVVTVRADMEPLVAKLIIDCRAEDAVIKVDGQVVGGCPTIGDVSAGIHEITVSSPSSRQYSRTVEVGPGGEMTVSVALEPMSGGAPAAPAEAPRLEPDEDVTETDAPETKQKKASPKLIAGIASLVAGAGMGVVGAVFTAKGSQDVDRGDDLWVDMAAANTRGDEEEFNELRDEYVDIMDDDIPTHRAVMIAGYAAGGALVAAGVVLTALGLKDEEREKTAAASVFPYALGIAGRF